MAEMTFSQFAAELGGIKRLNVLAASSNHPEGVFYSKTHKEGPKAGQTEDVCAIECVGTKQTVFLCLSGTLNHLATDLVQAKATLPSLKVYKDEFKTAKGQTVTQYLAGGRGTSQSLDVDF